MFRFNPYNFTITIDEAIQPPGIPIDYVQMRNPAGRRAWVPPGTDFADDNPDRILAPGGGPGSGKNFNDLSDEQQAPIQQNVRANVAASQQASVTTPMTPEEKKGRMKAFAAIRAEKLKRRNGGTATPPVSAPPLPPPPTGAGSPPPPATTSTGISARRQKTDTFVGGLASAASSIGGSTNRRPDRFGDPGRLIQGLYDAGKVAYDYMKTPGTPGSAATATSPAVAATPGRFDPRAGSRMARAGVGAIAGTMVGGPVGGLIGAGIGALTGRRKPIPEERYYRVYKMISQHDHR